MKKIGALLLVLLTQATLATAICNETTGENKNTVCSYYLDSESVSGPYEYATNTIEACTKESPLEKTLSVWLRPGHDNIRSNMAIGHYDDAVKRVWESIQNVYLWDKYSRRVEKRYGGESCDAITPSSLLGYSHGLSIHWSGLLFSLIRASGVPEERAQIWEYTTPEAPGFPDGGGQAVVAYKTDSGGEMDWWVLDLTCCQSQVWLNDWKSLCNPCVCKDNGCVATVTDGELYVKTPSEPFKSQPLATACNC